MIYQVELFIEAQAMKMLSQCHLRPRKSFLNVLALFLSSASCFLNQEPRILSSWRKLHPPAGCFTSAAVEAGQVQREEGVVSPVQNVDEMPPFVGPDNLTNRYYLLRHGQSTANVASIISSSGSLAYSDRHGLTDFGYLQGKDSAKQLLDLLGKISKPGDSVVMVSSPFARAVQTAQACLDGLSEPEATKRIEEDMKLNVCRDIVYEDNLVERYFGRLDGEAIYTYAYVWPLDKFDSTHTAFDVESVAAVATRIRSVIEGLESKYSNAHVVLVSHADVLQIAQLYASHADNVGEFSSYRFQNGEVRPMVFGSTSHLPEPDPLQAPRRGTSKFTTSIGDLYREGRRMEQ